jgi:hypothetical protein
MKTFNWLIILFAVVGFAIISCSDETSPPVASTSLNNFNKMGDDMHIATGSAHWRFITNQTNVRFSFSAIQHLNGEITGQVLDLDQGPYVKLKGDVYDLEVEENLAKICFIITRGIIMIDGEPLDLAGWVCAFIVQDVGNGNNAGDRVSWIDGAPPGTIYPNGMTIEEFNAQEIDDYITSILSIYGTTLEDYMPPIEYGSVNVR